MVNTSVMVLASSVIVPAPHALKEAFVTLAQSIS
jgi:hypothetical protein